MQIKLKASSGHLVTNGRSTLGGLWRALSQGGHVTEELNFLTQKTKADGCREQGK